MSTQIVLLGTGTPRADPQRIGACVAIIVDDQPYLIDFGPGLMLRIAQAQRAGITALAASQLTRAFLTHLHADHCVGYPDLIFSAWLHGRADPLEVYGPRGLAAMTDHIMAAYQASTEEHLRAHPTDPDGYKVRVHEIDPGFIYQDERVAALAVPADHGDLVAFAYRFTTPDKTILISGDTCPCTAIAEAARGCDVLIHEAYSETGLQGHTPQWQVYHRRVHSAAADVGRLAAEAGVKKLILYHQLLWGATEEDLLAEARHHYDGEVLSARDLDVV